MNGQAGGSGLECMEDGVSRPAHQTCRTISNEAWYLDPARTHIEEANNTMPERVARSFQFDQGLSRLSYCIHTPGHPSQMPIKPGQGQGPVSVINSLNDRTLRAARGTPARIIGATQSQEGGISMSDALTKPRLSIAPHRAVHWTKEPRLVARADPSTPQPRPMMSGQDAEARVRMFSVERAHVVNKLHGQNTPKSIDPLIDQAPRPPAVQEQ